MLLEALIGRAVTGKGRHIEVSPYHAIADWMIVPYLQRRYGGKTRKRQGLQPMEVFPTQTSTAPSSMQNSDAPARHRKTG